MYISQEEYKEAADSINQIIAEIYQARGQIVIHQKNIRQKKAMPTTPELTTYKSSHSASTASSSALDHTEQREVCDRPVNLKTDPDQGFNPESLFSDSESTKSHGSANLVIVEKVEP